MSNIGFLKFFFDHKPEKCRREVRFCSAAYIEANGSHPTNTSTFINRIVEDGDPGCVFEEVVENGGIGEICPDGVYRWIPWPCAVVEIRDL
jgi:hypothetical protein